jgi:hypothetical protein
MNDVFPVPRELKLRLIISYVVASAEALVAVVAFLFKLRAVRRLRVSLARTAHGGP